MIKLTLLDEKDASGRSVFRLEEDYVFQVAPNCTITVPKGYETNFGTIPRAFYWLVAPADLREWAVVHDYLSNEDIDPTDEDCWESGYSRWMADALLYEAMRRGKFSVPRRVAVFSAVRAYANWLDFKNRWKKK